MSHVTQRWVIRPAPAVRGELRVPGDKSISHRALMLGGLARGDTRVVGFLDSADCLATLQALRAMGVAIEQDRGEVSIKGVGLAGLREAAAPLDMGNAGTAIRLFMGLLAGQPFGSTLTGDESLRRRPMERVAAPLRLMGASIHTTAGRPPLRIEPVARLRGIDYLLPVASAQVKSAVLLAGLQADGTTSVTEPAPTRDHTERMLTGFGVPVNRVGARVSLAGMSGARQLRGATVQVPGDISSAAFFIVAGCLAASPSLMLRAVGINPTRTGILEILKLMGAQVRVIPCAEQGAEPVADIEIHASRLRGAVIPEHLVPLAIDELPVIFIAAACAEGETRITGAAELRVKESDRLAAMAQGLGSLGVAHQLLPDGIVIQGLGHAGRFPGGRIDSHGDHRIAMSFAVASLRATDPIVIDDVANVATSFPGFDAAARGIGLLLETA